ncbi:MAG: glycoside hydrolase family 104 protein [Polyangiales bacterium]
MAASAFFATGCIPGEDCNPGNAFAAVSTPKRVMLDVIAWTEGTSRIGAKDGYNVMFTGRQFGSCVQHPNVKNCSGGLCSTAAGRYQFLKGTWDGLGFPDFFPASQDRGAIELIRRRGVNLSDAAALTTSQVMAAMDKLSYEWASLPPGRYGQPVRTMDEVVFAYRAFANNAGL